MITAWFDTINPSNNTKRNYTLAVNSYCKFTGRTPTELITDAEEEVMSGVLMRQRSVKARLLGFRNHLQNLNLAPLTVKLYMSGIVSFYRTADIELPVLPRAKKKVLPLEKHGEIPTKENLQAVLKICDPLEKAILLVGVSSGLSANEIMNLTVKDFNDGYDEKIKIVTLKLRRAKVNNDFITFLSSESTDAVLEYLEYRNRTVKRNDPKRERQLQKQCVMADSNFLFISRKVPDSFLKTHNDEERKLTRDAFMKIYRGLSEKAKLNTPTGDWNMLRSHTVRKYFNSVLLNEGADSFFVEYCMGHTLDGTRAAYFRASPEKLREIYLKFVSYLTIQKEAVVSESPEYLRIKQENSILQAETAKHIVERRELQELRAEIEKMKETFYLDHQQKLLDDLADKAMKGELEEE